jgi:hypothetical protein
MQTPKQGNIRINLVKKAQKSKSPTTQIPRRGYWANKILKEPLARRAYAKSLKNWRRGQFEGMWGASFTRGAKSIWTTFKFPILNIIREEIKLNHQQDNLEKNKLESSAKQKSTKQKTKMLPSTKIFDSGAGTFVLSQDIKEKFGKNVSITAVNLAHPNNPKAIGEEKANKKSFMVIKEWFARNNLVTRARKAAERTKYLDRLIISPIEEISPEGKNRELKNKFSVVIDIYGGLFHTYGELLNARSPGERIIAQKFVDRIIYNYFQILSPNGILILTTSASEYKSNEKNPFSIAHYIEKQLGPSSESAKKSGYFMSIEQSSQIVNGDRICVVRKIPLPKIAEELQAHVPSTPKF